MNGYAEGVLTTTHVQSRRLAAVQAPVIPIVGRWIAETPGTHLARPGRRLVRPAARGDRGGAARSDRALGDHRYGPVEGLPTLVEALEEKLARENGIAVRPREPRASSPPAATWRS